MEKKTWMLHEKNLFFFLKNNIMSNVYVWSLYVFFFHKKRSKGDTFFISNQQKAYQTSQNSDLLWKEKIMLQRELLSSLIYCSVFKQITNGK